MDLSKEEENLRTTRSIPLLSQLLTLLIQLDKIQVLLALYRSRRYKFGHHSNRKKPDLPSSSKVRDKHAAVQQAPRPLLAQSGLSTKRQEVSKWKPR